MVRLGKWESLQAGEKDRVDRILEASARKVDSMCYRGDNAFAKSEGGATERTFAIEGPNSYLWVDDYQAATTVSDNGVVLAADQWAMIEPAGTGRPRRALRRLGGRHWLGPVAVMATWNWALTPQAIISAVLLIFRSSYRTETKPGSPEAVLNMAEVERTLKPYRLVLV